MPRYLNSVLFGKASFRHHLPTKRGSLLRRNLRYGSSVTTFYFNLSERLLAFPVDSIQKAVKAAWRARLGVFEAQLNIPKKWKEKPVWF